MEVDPQHPTGRPSALDRPVNVRDPAWARLPAEVAAQLEPELPGDPVFLVLPTGTRVDVGGWTGPRRVWVLARRDRLTMVAWGVQPLHVEVPFADLADSLYNHVTGAVDLAPAPDCPVTALRCAPPEGAQILAQIHQEEPVHA